jgi:hypothetical protein
VSYRHRVQQTHWDTQFEALAAEWSALSEPVIDPVELMAWNEQVMAMQAQMDHLRDTGRWAAGPHDLMSIVGLNRWELAHSAAIAWLCTPDAGHGLGSSFLRALIERTGDPVSLAGPVTTVLEEGRDVLLPRDGTYGDLPTVATSIEPDADDLPHSVLWPTRADVVVRGPGWTLVIEVKVDAVEGISQARRLYEGWKDDPDARFLFLTRSGRPPQSMPEHLRGIWACMAWRDLRLTLEGLAATSNATAIARPALLDYLRTLRTTF